MSSPYALEAPSVQQTLDLFKGKWASRLPPPFEGANAGDAALFEDPRVDWAKDNLGELGIKMNDSAALELGPLEGGHTYGLIKAGAKSVTAIEAHPRGFFEVLGYEGAIGHRKSEFHFRRRCVLPKKDRAFLRRWIRERLSLSHD